MWYLVSSADPDVKYVLLVGREYTVGRKDCDVLLTTDPTVSRKHASLQIAHAESNLSHPQKSALVTLKDLSKFGTWVNKKRVSGEMSMKDGDEVAFGSPKSVFLIVNEPFVITTSCLDPVSKKSTKAIVRMFGGHIVSEWTKTCSLLIMNNISVTIKVICALITQKSIVLPVYLEKLQEHYKENGEKPNPEDFQPLVSETQVNPEEVSFNPNPNRASVFKGMKFIFLSQRQFKKMNLAVELASGMPILMEEGSDDNDDRVLVEPGTVVMNCGPEEMKTLTPAGQEWVAHVNKYLKRKKKSLIQDAEIGYAVLYCSTEKHCNPDIDKAQQLFQNIPSQSLSQCVPEQSVSDVLVANTETSPGDKRKARARGAETTGGKGVLDETVFGHQVGRVKTETISQNSATPNKRKRGSDVKEEDTLPKRIKQEQVTPVKSQPRSRTHAAVKQDPHEEEAPEERNLTPPPEGEVNTVAKSRGRKSHSPSAGRTVSPKPRSRSPSPSPSRRSSRIQKASPAREVIEDVILQEVDQEGTSRKDRRKRSVSPKPGQAKKMKTEVVDSDDDFDVGVKSPTSKRVPKGKSGHSRVHTLSDDEFDLSIRSASGKAGSSTKMKTEVDEDVGITPSVKVLSPKPKRKTVLDDSDEEDIGLWQGSRRTKGQKQTTSAKGDNSDDMMDIPSSKGRKPEPKREERRNSDEGDDLFDDIPSRRTKTERSPVVKTTNRMTTKSRRSPSPARSPSPKPSRQTKREVIEDSEEEDTVKQQRPRKEDKATERGEGSSSGGFRDNRSLPSGFLTTRLPIKNQTVKREDFIKEEDMPTSVMVTEFVDLVARRPKPPAKASSRKDIPDGCVEWKGKVVKNFKRFKKTSHAGANFLPRIIGGSDLVAHIGDKRKEMDDWFKDALQAESQENEREREAQDLFNWDPRVGRTAKRSR